MKQKLPINIDSVMTSYSYYAFPQCIITAKDRIGNLIAEFTILDSPKTDWKPAGNIQQKGNTDSWMVISTDQYREDCNGCIYRKIEPEDHISIQVDFQQYTEPWAAINLFITDNTDNILLGDIDYLCRFGHFKYDGTSLYINGEYQHIHKKRLYTPYNLVLAKKGNSFDVYAGENRAECLASQNLNLPDDKELYIGVQVKHRENSVYPWIFSNFIQLSSDITNLDRRLEFHYGTLKHWDCNLFHYFLDTNRYNADDILSLGGLKYIKNCLNKGKYIETKLDQYYIADREEYHNFHHLHQNLIYGYDDRIKYLYIVGYTNNGKLVKTKIKYADAVKSIKQNKNILFKIITYEQDSYPMDFDPDYVKQMIQQYLDGTNSSKMLQHIIPASKRTYGIKIYDELTTDQGIEVLISDRRIAHVLWEHKLCMAERINYITAKGFLTPETGCDLNQKMKELANQIFDLKNILLKYQKRPEKTNYELIKNYLKKIQLEEKQCLEHLIVQWKEFKKHEGNIHG